MEHENLICLCCAFTMESDAKLVVVFASRVWGEWYEVFGDGEDYAYALGKENGEDVYYEQKPEPRLKDVFEPGVLAERMMTDMDEIIRAKDVPERMQLRPGIQADRVLTDVEIEEEAYWLTTHMNQYRKGVDQQQFLDVNVKYVLKFMSQELLEVPFIETHRRDYFTNVAGQKLTELLSRDDLWYIYDMDLKFRTYLERRETLKALMEKLNINDEYLAEQMIGVNKVEELGDIFDYVNLRFAKQIDKTKAFKRPGSGGSYDTAKREHLDGFIKLLNADSQKFGKCLAEGRNVDIFDDPVVDPKLAAENYVTDQGGFNSPERVISLAMNMCAQEIAVDPVVRKEVRSKFDSVACVTVTPTEKGAVAIDELHPYYPFKRLNQKYVRDFHDGQFLQILQAQSEGLVKVEIKIPNETEYLKTVSDYLQSDGTSETAEKWNELRRKIVTSALKEQVLVLMERSVTEQLRSRAEEWVAKKCQMALEEVCISCGLD